MKTRSLAARAVVLSLALSGCASYGPGDLHLGDDEAAVVRSMGRAAARFALPGGVTRLVYARGPFGKHTFMVELGTDGRVLRWYQALGEAEFARLEMGTGADELLRTYGPPAHRQARGIRPGQVWSYRYDTFDCRWFRVTLDENQRVVETSYSPDPLCEVNEHAWHRR